MSDKKIGVAEDLTAELIAIVSKIKKPQVYMIQNVDYYSDILWSLWKSAPTKQNLLNYHNIIVKSGAQVARQFVTGRPMAELARGDGAWFRGNADQAAKHWRASAEVARTLVMPYNAAHALYRLVDTGLDNGAVEQAMLHHLIEGLDIPRPSIWAL